MLLELVSYLDICRYETNSNICIICRSWGQTHKAHCACTDLQVQLIYLFITIMTLMLAVMTITMAWFVTLCFFFSDTGCVHVRPPWLSKAMSALKKKHRCENQCFFSPQFINHHHLTTLPMVSYHVIITISSQSIMITIDRSLACVLLQGIATKVLTVSIIGREGITGDGEGSSCLW